MKKRDDVPAAVLGRSPSLQRKALARQHAVRTRAITVPANAWLDRLIHRSPAFEARVAEELAAINVAQELVVLRESRGLSQAQLAGRIGVTRSAIAQLESAQPDNIELRTLVRVAAALDAHLDVSIRQCQPTERKARQRARVKANQGLCP